MLNETSCKLIYKDMMKYINMGYEKVVILVVLTTPFLGLAYQSAS